MADLLKAFLNMPHENIKAYTDTIKTILVLIGGAAVSGVGIINALIVHKNSKITKANTASNETADAISAAYIKELKVVQNAVTVSLTETVNQVKAELLKEITKIKIVETKVSAAADQKLGMIPKVQDALARIETKHAEYDEIFKKLSDGIKKKESNKP